MQPSAVDESWGRLAPAVAASAGIQVVYGYLSNDASKNLSSAEIRGYHKAGIAVWLGWESQPGRPRSGAAAGTKDATSAASQLRAHYAALGYHPHNRLSVPFSCDTDISTGELPTLLSYYEAARRPLEDAEADPGAYGEYDLIEYLFAHGFTRGLFQTYAWSYGRRSAHADLFQYQIDQRLGGVDVDYDQVLNAALLGAWWPPGHPLDTEEAVDLTKQNLDDIRTSCVAPYFVAADKHQHSLDKQLRAQLAPVMQLLDALGTRIAQLQADLTKTSATLAALQSAHVEINQQVPVNGTLTVGGAK